MKGRAGIAPMILATLVASDVVFVIITQGWSPVAGDVGTTGFAVRLVVLAGLVVRSRRARRDRYSLALFFLSLVSLFHFHVTTERRVGDGFFYYAYVQSFWKDFDVDFDQSVPAVRDRGARESEAADRYRASAKHVLRRAGGVLVAFLRPGRAGGSLEEVGGARREPSRKRSDPLDGRFVRHICSPPGTACFRGRRSSGWASVSF